MTNTPISLSQLNRMVLDASSGLGEISTKLNTEKETNAELAKRLENLKKENSETFHLLHTKIEEAKQSIESIDASNPEQKKEAQKLLAEISKIIEGQNAPQNNPSRQSQSPSTSSSQFPPP